ncbi:MAG: aminopeptidase [Lachnospiraceae bacterium]|nr:aminopeptidase [Lachnospiraceae bacterium]
MTDNEELELNQLRFTLAIDRIREIPEEKIVQEPFADFFRKEALFLLRLQELKTRIEGGWMETAGMEELQEVNHSLYEDILPGQYETSYGNPAYAHAVLGEEYGSLFSFLYAELAGCITYVYEKRDWDFLVSLELFLEFYSAFQEEILPEAAHLKDILVSYINDYCPQFMEYRVRELVDPTLSFAADIIEGTDLSDLRYLYRFGEYITENELRTAAFLNSLPEEEIKAMASTYTEGYRIGFEVTGKDLSKKKTVNIRFCLGFERMVKAAIRQFRVMGLEPVIYRCASHSLNKRGNLRIGFYGAIPNQQFDYDHKNDAAIYLDEKLVTRKLRAQQEAFESYKQQANTHAGPACIDVFGEIPFVPVSKKEALQLSKEQQKLQVRYDSEAGQITNRYIIGEERSFTIIAYPIPEIGENFEEIFRETVRINTLDYKKYQKLQQILIDALDQGEKVRILGMNGNETDLTIQLHSLANPEKQTNFENCVADVNIPVGEVFTSPVLTGTNGLLHVKGVYLESFHYDDLKIRVRDGMTADYSCANFASEEENRRYIEENILFHHDSLPMGEFAIGTNTTAYHMAKDFAIADKLPILIAEKMGPHFAFGDTCYSWAEDTAVYNPDGKEIIARDNECSLKRKEDVSLAYFGCHTDITIPYDELGSITVICKDGREVPIIEKGRFVLAGTEELNEPLDE